MVVVVVLVRLHVSPGLGPPSVPAPRAPSPPAPEDHPTTRPRSCPRDAPESAGPPRPPEVRPRGTRRTTPVPAALSSRPAPGSRARPPPRDRGSRGAETRRPERPAVIYPAGQTKPLRRRRPPPPAAPTPGGPTRPDRPGRPTSRGANRGAGPPVRRARLALDDGRRRVGPRLTLPFTFSRPEPGARLAWDGYRDGGHASCRLDVVPVVSEEGEPARRGRDRSGAGRARRRRAGGRATGDAGDATGSNGRGGPARGGAGPERMAEKRRDPTGRSAFGGPVLDGGGASGVGCRAGLRSPPPVTGLACRRMPQGTPLRLGFPSSGEYWTTGWDRARCAGKSNHLDPRHSWTTCRVSDGQPQFDPYPSDRKTSQFIPQNSTFVTTFTVILQRFPIQLYVSSHRFYHCSCLMAPWG